MHACMLRGKELVESSELPSAKHTITQRAEMVTARIKHPCSLMPSCTGSSPGGKVHPYSLLPSMRKAYTLLPTNATLTAGTAATTIMCDGHGLAYPPFHLSREDACRSTSTRGWAPKQALTCHGPKEFCKAHANSGPPACRPAMWQMHCASTRCATV